MIKTKIVWVVQYRTWIKFSIITIVKKAITQATTSNFQKTSFGLVNLRAGN